MKTFKEHKNRTPTFLEYLKEDISSLRRDLESLSINNKTYNINDISDAFTSRITESAFVDEELCELSIDEEFDIGIEGKESGTTKKYSTTIVYFVGNIELKSIDTNRIIKEIKQSISNDDADEELPRYTWEQIVDALESVDWENYITVEASDAEVKITKIRDNENKVYMEYELDPETYFLTADVNDMWEVFKNELKKIAEK